MKDFSTNAVRRWWAHVKNLGVSSMYLLATSEFIPGVSPGSATH